VFCRLVVLVRLSVPVQVIDWKDDRLQNDLWCVDGNVKPYSLTHSLTHSLITLYSFLSVIIFYAKFIIATLVLLTCCYL